MLFVHFNVNIYRHNLLFCEKTYRSSNHGCMFVTVNLPDVVLHHHFKPAVHWYSAFTTAGFQIFPFNRTLCIGLKNTSLHMWAKLAGCPVNPFGKSFHSFLFLKQRRKIPQARWRSCWGRGAVAWGGDRREESSEEQMFHLKQRGALLLFLACEAALWCVITCSFLHSGARTFRVSTLDSDITAWASLTLSASLSFCPTAGQKSNESSILGNPDCLTVNACALMSF